MFTVSNLGMFGVRFQADQLPAGRDPRGRLVARTGSLSARRSSSARVTLTLRCDHRAVYGAEAARFLARLCELLESRSRSPSDAAIEFRDAIRTRSTRSSRATSGDPLRRGRRGRRRRVRGHAGPVREVRPAAGVRHADLGARDDGRRVRRGGHRDAPGARDHVRRLPRALDGQPHQPGDEVLVPDRGAGERAARDPLGRRRGRALRRDPLADADLVADGDHRAQDRRALDAGRREGAPEGRDPRRQPGDLLRAQAAVLDRGRRSRREPASSARRRSCAKAATSRS